MVLVENQAIILKQSRALRLKAVSILAETLRSHFFDLARSHEIPYREDGVLCAKKALC